MSSASATIETQLGGLGGAAAPRVRAKRKVAQQKKLACSEEEIRKSWFVVQCRSAQEESARQRLEEQGYTAYLPKVLDQRSGKDRVSPLFPCYLFLHFDPFVKSMRPVASTRGVVHMIRFADRWAVVHAAVIKALQAQENENGLRVLKMERFSIGEKVALIDGPFAGMVASVVQDDARIDYVVVSLDWIRRLSVARGSLVRAFAK